VYQHFVQALEFYIKFSSRLCRTSFISKFYKIHLKSKKHKLKYDDIDLCVCHFWSETSRNYGKLRY